MTAKKLKQAKIAIVAGIVALGIMGIVIYEAFDIVERRLTRWRRA